MDSSFAPPTPVSTSEPISERISERDLPGGTSQVLPAVSGMLRGLIVLVVEDDADGRDMLVECMTSHGARTFAAAHAAAAYHVLATEDVDAIVTDVAMPDEDGITMLKRARRDLRSRHIPCIVVSGSARREDACDIEGAPITFFQKPADIFAIVAAVWRLTRSAG